MGIYEDYINSPNTFEDTTFNSNTGDDQIQQALTNLKASKLNSRAEQKLNRINGVDYSPDQAATLQQGLSDVMDQQIYTATGPDGLPYKYQIDPITGQKIPYSGETRNLYIAQGKDGSYKLGLARNDLTDRAKELGLTPFKARYADKSDPLGIGYNSPYINEGGDYDGTPGLDGVDPNQDPYLDVELPYELATAYEKKVHSSSGQIKNRAIGEGAVDGQDIVNYGHGKTEYSTADAPLWNLNYQEDGTPIADGTPIPGQPRAGNDETEDTLESIDAFQASTVNLGGKMAALVGESYNNTANMFRDKELTSDNALEAWGKDLQTKANEIAGYNPKALEEGTMDIQEGFKDYSTGNYLGGTMSLIKGMIKAGPQVVAGSLPELGAIAATAYATGGTGTLAAIGTIGAGNANQILDEREKLNGGRKATTNEVSAVFGAEALATALDYGSFKFLTGGKVLFKGDPKPRKLDSLLKEMADTDNVPTLKKELVNALGRGVARSAASGSTEFIQEGTTEIIRTLATEIGTDEFKNEDWVDNLNRNGIDILTSATLGAAGGVGFGAYHDGKETAKDIGDALNTVNEQVTRDSAASNMESKDAALEARTVRSLDVNAAEDALKTAHDAQAGIEDATTVNEMYKIVDTLEATDTSSAREYAKIQATLEQMEGIENPALGNVKKALFYLSEKSIDNIVRTGQGLNKDIKSLNNAIDSEILPDAVATETGETTFQDAEDKTQYKYTGEELTSEIKKTEDNIANHEAVIEDIASKYADDKDVTIEEARTAVEEDHDVAQSMRMISDLKAKHEKLISQQDAEQAKVDIADAKEAQMAKEGREAQKTGDESPEAIKAAEEAARVAIEDVNTQVKDLNDEIARKYPKLSEEDAAIVASYTDEGIALQAKHKELEDTAPKPKKKYSSKSTQSDLTEIANDTIQEGLPEGIVIPDGLDLKSAKKYLANKQKLLKTILLSKNKQLKVAGKEDIKALRDTIKMLGEREAQIGLAKGSLAKRYKEANKYKTLAKQLAKTKKKTVGDLEQAAVSKLEKGLEPDKTVTDKIDGQVKDTIKKAKRVAVKPTNLVKKFMAKFDAGDGTAADAKARFEERISKLSSKAIDQLLEEENLNSLVDNYKDKEGNIHVNKAYLKKSLESVLNKRNKSKKYFNTKVVAEAATGTNGQKIALAQAAIHQAVATGDVEGFTSKIESLLDAINNSSVLIKSKLLKHLDSLTNDEGEFELYLGALADGSVTKEAILKNIELTKDLLNAQVNDVKNIKKVVLRVSRADTADITDIKFARDSLKILKENGEIDNKQKVLLAQLLDKVLDRSTIKAREAEVQAKEEEAIITKNMQEEIDADASLTEAQKKMYKDMPAAIYHQLFKNDAYDTDAIKTAMNTALANEDIKPEDIYVDDC